MCSHFSAVCLQFSKKYTASQTHFGSTNMGSNMHHFWATAFYFCHFSNGTPCTIQYYIHRSEMHNFRVIAIWNTRSGTWMDRKNSLRGHDGWLFSRNWIFGGYWLSINDLKWCQRPRGSTAFFWFFVSFLMSDSSKTNQSLTICTKTSPRSPEISNAILKQFSKRIEKVPFISIL